MTGVSATLYGAKKRNLALQMDMLLCAFSEVAR